MSRFSEKEISKQESLTPERLKAIAAGYTNLKDRPIDSLIEVIHWARRYIENITQMKDWVPFIHNKISIDGAFLQYCEESGLRLEAVHTDAITSWNTDSNDEHFVGIGIFEIKDRAGWTFYHCGLFHKGNQNEDEVSFFVFVRQEDYEKYKSVRNSFDNWQKKRERDSQEIEVIGGNPISYELDVDWDTLFLPEDLKNRITTTVEGFLKSEDTYRRLKVPWRRGIGFWGPRGCHAKGSKILMYDGNIKNVEDVVVGDLLMGPDSKPRKVLELVRGQDEMFEIQPSKSKPFVVNGEHILHLKTDKSLNLPDTINISVNEYLCLSNFRKNRLFLRKPNIVEFESTKKSYPNKDHHVYGIKEIKSLGVGDYYGFVLNKDHLYLTDDFFVFHNCGKTSCLRLLMAKYQEFKPVTIQPGHSSPDELLEDAFEYAEDHAPSLLFFEDLQELVKTIDLRHFLQLLDGLQKRDGILTVVTGNDFSDLQENLKSRPRRFDRFFEFPLPDNDQCKKYLSKYFADILTPKKIETIAKKAVKKKFTYAHLQEVYFNAVFIAIPEGREIPNEADINLSIKQVIEEKEAADSDFIAKQRDLTDDIEYEREDL